MIKLFLSDVDATLTDGIYHTTENGEISKNFFTRDFHGFLMLHESGVKIGVITVANDDVIVHQCKRGAKYVTVMKGVKDKLAFIADNYVNLEPSVAWNEIAFIGDDVFDIELLRNVGLCGCPYNAVDEVLEIVETRASIDIDETEGFMSRFDGGKGCVREFAEYVLEVNTINAAG